SSSTLRTITCGCWRTAAGFADADSAGSWPARTWNTSSVSTTRNAASEPRTTAAGPGRRRLLVRGVRSVVAAMTAVSGLVLVLAAVMVLDLHAVLVLRLEFAATRATRPARAGAQRLSAGGRRDHRGCGRGRDRRRRVVAAALRLGLPAVVAVHLLVNRAPVHALHVHGSDHRSGTRGQPARLAVAALRDGGGPRESPST